MNSEKIGKLISCLRKEKGITQKELGDILKVSYKTISKWETGNGLPDISILKEVSDALGVSIDELLTGEIKTKKENNKINMFKIIIPIIILLLIIFSILIITLFPKQQKENNCTVIRTYYIDSIGKSNDENYLYITIHEFQIEGTYTVKLPKIVSKDLEVGNSYEFTFETNNKYTDTMTDKLFNNSDIINIIYTNKEGLDRTNIYYCN